MPELTNPQSLNRYSWVLGNPLKFVDPTGHKEEGACSDPNEECIDDEIYDAYWSYCAENPGDPACQSGDPLEAGFWFLAGVSGGAIVEDLISIGGGLLGDGLTKAIGWIGSLLCGDGNCGDEVKTAYQIGEEGEDLVFKFLNDPTLQREAKVYVNEAGKRANYFARLDGLTETAIHEVKNVANLSLSQDFMDQAQRYKLFADSMGVELHYWLINSAPQNVVDWLKQLGATVHTSVP